MEIGGTENGFLFHFSERELRLKPRNENVQIMHLLV